LERSHNVIDALQFLIREDAIIHRDADGLCQSVLDLMLVVHSSEIAR
jgi:hypothetical protein